VQYFDRHILLLTLVDCMPHRRKAALPQDAQQQVATVGESITRFQPPPFSHSSASSKNLKIEVLSPSRCEPCFISLLDEFGKEKTLLLQLRRSIGGVYSRYRSDVPRCLDIAIVVQIKVCMVWNNSMLQRLFVAQSRPRVDAQFSRDRCKLNN
jgi:hypothetical protein